jgi:hypothetical protein
MVFDPNAPNLRRPAGGPVLDMTPDGQFRASRPVVPLGFRIGAVAFVIAILAGALALAALALWFALLLVPVAIAAAGFAWVAFRFQLWRGRRGRGIGRHPAP